MKKILFTALLVILSATFSNAQIKDVSAVWGKVVRSDKAIKGVTYKYFIYYEQDGVSHAYPLETDKKEIADLVEKNVGKHVKIEGQVKEVSLIVEGPPKKSLVFIPSNIKPLTLSELAISDKVTTTQKPKKILTEKAEYTGGGIRVNDQVANSLIYTGAAIMLGAALKNVIFKVP